MAQPAQFINIYKLGFRIFGENGSGNMYFNINKNDESKIIFVYRYLSLFITSMFYLVNHPEHSILRKIFIILCISISAIILSYLYPNYENSRKNIKILLTMETIANVILLIPSGGINSPFIWYTLNTILISSIYLKSLYCWFNFFAYLISYLIILKFGSTLGVSGIVIQKEQSNLLLSFLMIIVAIQIIGIYIKKTKLERERLERSNNQLELENILKKESIDHIKNLYQSVNILANQGNKEGIINFSFENIIRITKASTVFYFDITEDTKKMYSYGDKNLIDKLDLKISSNLEDILEKNDFIELSVLDRQFIIVPIKANYLVYGILGLEATYSKESLVYKENVYQLNFLSELISTAFERLALEEVNERLLISEEQNRIANEIHDSVLQKLFSMSCGIYSTIKKLNIYTSEEIENDLNLLRNTTDTVMKDLREKIYGLSWNKSGSNSFSLDVKRYINDIKKLNNVNIPFTVLGNVEILSTNQKKALYRMICEGLSNSVRHGKANNIEIKLNINKERTCLSIKDDGMGFDLKQTLEDKTRGLGLQNLYQLTESLQGEIHIYSEMGIGTTIEITMPNYLELVKGEAAI